MFRVFFLSTLFTVIMAVDAVTVDGSGTTINGALTVTGVAAINNATVTRSTQATATEVVRGDDPRLANSIRAWANFEGTPSGAVIRASSNILSIQRVSEGYYRITLQNALPNANYAVIVTASANRMVTATYEIETARTNQVFEIVSASFNGQTWINADKTIVSVAVIGN